MLDGGMGSIRFIHGPKERGAGKFGVAQLLYDDIDGVLVSFSLNLDTCGEPWEIDAWKVDNSPLLQPPISKINLRSP